MSSKVEANLRSQSDAWRQIMERVAGISTRELPLEQPKRILLFGLGSSHFAARLAAYALMRDRNRPRIPVIATHSMAVGTELIPGLGDWAFAISHRGTSKPTTDALNLCDRSGAFTALVSGVDAKPAESARFHLETCELETVEPHTVSVTSAICAITTLILGSKAMEEWDALRSLGNPDLESLRRKAGEGPTLILGEWEGEWLAREAALKVMEMARLPVRAFGSEEYFHGPRFSSRGGETIWHVSVPKDPRASEISAAHTVQVNGATPLGWMPALVELQWLALATALNLGVNPDDPTV